MEQLNQEHDPSDSYRQKYAYDTRGNLVLIEFDRLDENDTGEGIPDTVHFYEYDEEGNQVVWTSTGTFASGGDFSTERISTYDERRNLLSTTGYDERGVATFAIYHSYDSKGNVLVSESDFDADGEFELRRTFGYDCWDQMGEPL